MSGDVKFFGVLIGTPVVIFWLLVLLPRKAGILLSVVAIALTLYAFWFNVMNDKPDPGNFNLGPYLRSVMALAALAGPLMALVFHLIGQRTWRWRAGCFAAGFPLGYALVELYAGS